jgi:hypothetical protein
MISSMTLKGGSVNDRRSEAPTRILEQQNVIKTSANRQQQNSNRHIKEQQLSAEIASVRT